MLSACRATFTAIFTIFRPGPWLSGRWASGDAFFGSLALLLRSKWAVTLFGISIVGLLGTTFYERVVAVVPAELQTTGQTLFAVAIWVITIGLFFYARRMRAAGVLR